MLDYLQNDNSESKLRKHPISWNKFDTDLLNPSQNLFHYTEKQDVSLPLSANSSTLSLHIAAYENSIEDSEANSDEKVFKDLTEKLNQDTSGLGKTLKNVKQFFTAESSKGPFEFPRQQKDIKSDPEVMQFKASQKLLDPNESNSTPKQNRETDFPRKRRDVNEREDHHEVPAKRVYDGQNSAMQNMIETIEIPDNVVGLVIGRGGEQVAYIQQQTNCRLQMAGEPTPQQTRFCTLNGTRENIDRARNMISELLGRAINIKPASTGEQPFQQSTGAAPNTPNSGIPPGCIQRVLSIPGTKCGLIIGRNGDTIKSLQETLGVKMLLIQENQTISHGPKPLRITGTSDKVENACRTIESIINSEDVRPQYAKSVGEVIVPRSSVGIIIGKSGETIKRLINESGCKIQFKPD
uniref:K Homology domain-containing protein n=1 Tax=Panagrolaimus sp. ES5 TaxID=591445 RepID=A0AC34FTS0_9BILA